MDFIYPHPLGSCLKSPSWRTWSAIPRRSL